MPPVSYRRHVVHQGNPAATHADDGNYVIVTNLSNKTSLIIRPPDIVCRRTYVYQCFFFLLLSFFLLFRHLISQLAEQNRAERQSARLSEIKNVG